MNRLESVLKNARTQLFHFKLADTMGNSTEKTVGTQKSKEFLIFPRKKVNMHKMRSGNWTPEAWFIKNRTDIRATSLEESTDDTGYGLTSGLRSGIIRDKDGNYIKLKGIAPKTELSHGRGMCSLEEAFDEFIRAYALWFFESPARTMKPRFIELHLRPQKKYDLERFMTGFNMPRFYYAPDPNIDRDDPDAFKHEIGRHCAFIKQLEKFDINPDDYCAVPGFQIEGDTRLDETIYHLTKKDVRGGKREIRDLLLQHLSFKAGVAKSDLSMHRQSWSGSLQNTNSHIGNFVVYVTNGRIDVGIADLHTLSLDIDFESKKEYHEHVKEELEYFEVDFIKDKVACSFPTWLKYEHFPRSLREKCLNAMKSGYFLNIAANKREMALPVKKPGRIWLPKPLFMSELEFREHVDYVTK